ncbi:Transposable element Tcb1 transposase [Araneus ventricosus]|uniref:Transposable element Tcb1 transposase n=1 Tax=Araneus ventricosus TaxID=182803 RepID=A0A4Y2EZB6_ARAVE|nr:Transposable element Tcb1 transposase [Araneus ventricosus]
MDWPPYSPDLTPCDYFLWGTLKDIVYPKHPATLDELESAICVACESISVETLRNVMVNFILRLRHLCCANGEHFENIVIFTHTHPTDRVPFRRRVRGYAVVLCRLQAAGLNGRGPVKKPIISTKNRKAYVEWPETQKDMTKKEWEDVFAFITPKDMFFGTDEIQWIPCPQGTRFDPKYQIPTMKHGGGNLMVWECVSCLGMRPLRRIQGIMDKCQYEDILENTMRPYERNFHGRYFIFQQDNDPKHRFKHIQN